jgi:hypothetical protein
MLTTLVTAESLRAESEYRLERAKRDYRAANRRRRRAQAAQPEPRQALRPRPAA